MDVDSQPVVCHFPNGTPMFFSMVFHIYVSFPWKKHGCMPACGETAPLPLGSSLAPHFMGNYSHSSKVSITTCWPSLLRIYWRFLFVGAVNPDPEAFGGSSHPNEQKFKTIRVIVQRGNSKNAKSCNHGEPWMPWKTKLCSFHCRIHQDTMI